MKILIAEDDPVTMCRLEDSLTGWGYEVVPVTDGLTASQLLQQPEAPPLALLDWMMPGLDGLEVCRRVRAAQLNQPPYLILLTARGGKCDVVAGLEGGADDYLVKPLEDDELLAHLHVAERILRLRKQLADQVAELQHSLAQVKKLQGLLPICCYCKKIRTDESYWQQVETYIAAHSEAIFSHTICPACYEDKVRPGLENFLGHPAPASGESS
jgi:CheY-like chemotaxis protein